MTVKRSFLLIALVLTALGLVMTRRSARQGFPEQKVRDWLAASAPLSTAAVPAIVRSIRPNYPYSVIPGGAYSREEFLNWKRTDPVVRRHYEGFNSGSVRLVAAAADVQAYVSYRQNDQIFWTKKRLLIPRGELLITDGTNFARARCGNRIATTPPPDADQNGPNPGELSLPPFTLALFRNGVIPSAPGLELTGQIVFPVLPRSAYELPVPVVPPSLTADNMHRWTPFLLQGASGSGPVPFPSLETSPSRPLQPEGPSPVLSAATPEPGSVGVVGLLILLAGLGLRSVRKRRGSQVKDQVDSTSNSTLTE